MERLVDRLLPRARSTDAAGVTTIASVALLAHSRADLVGLDILPEARPRSQMAALRPRLHLPHGSFPDRGHEFSPMSPKGVVWGASLIDSG